MRNDVVRKGPSEAPHRSLLKVTGFMDGEINGPLIGVVTSQNDIISGHINLGKMVEAVKKRVLLPNGTPLVSPAIGIYNGIAMGHEGMKCFPATRELTADTIECMVKVHGLDTLALIPNCDKIVLDMMMAALRLNTPSIIVDGGSMLAGKFKGKEVSFPTIFEAVGAYENGTTLGGNLCELEDEAYPTCGLYLRIFAANSMNCLAEVLGLVLPGNGTISAVYSKRVRLAKCAGIRIMDLLEKDIKPRDIVNEKSIKSALTVNMTLGCLTNSVLHLTTIANEARVETDLDIINEMSSRTPDLCKLAPVSDTHIEDLYWAGDVQAVIMELSKKNLLELECITTTSRTRKENLKGVVVSDSNVIRSIENPYSTTGGIRVLKGNLVEDGVVVRKSVVLEEMLTHKGPARVFDPEEEVIETILSKKTIKGGVVIIRYEGPKGGPGIREMLSPTSAIVGVGSDKYVALITDGRFSGATKGVAIGHVSLEVAKGGDIALVEEGDTISMDISNRELELLVDEEMLARRRKDLKILESRVKEGYLVRYAKLANSASKEAIPGQWKMKERIGEEWKS